MTLSKVNHYFLWRKPPEPLLDGYSWMNHQERLGLQTLPAPPGMVNGTAAGLEVVEGCSDRTAGGAGWTYMARTSSRNHPTGASAASASVRRPESSLSQASSVSIEVSIQ